jgi:hypothetical protein
LYTELDGSIFVGVPTGLLPSSTTNVRSSFRPRQVNCAVYTKSWPGGKDVPLAGLVCSRYTHASVTEPLEDELELGGVELLLLLLDGWLGLDSLELVSDPGSDGLGPPGVPGS